MGINEKLTDSTTSNCVGVNAMSVPALPNQTFPLVQPDVRSDYFMKTKQYSA